MNLYDNEEDHYITVLYFKDTIGIFKQEYESWPGYLEIRSQAKAVGADTVEIEKTYITVERYSI